MMRWSNTKTYTEQDMQRMQQEAISRVHEFQTRAQRATGFYDVPASEIREFLYEPQEPILFQSVPDAPFGEMRAANAEGEVIEAESRLLPPAMQQQTHPKAATDPISGLIDKLGLDSETLLIIGLLFLLYNEKADNFLLMALGYLLL